MSRTPRRTQGYSNHCLGHEKALWRKSFRDLTELGFLKPSEEAMINKGQQFLWKLRYGLHTLSGRAEDRLLFNMQRELANLFGYEDDKSSLAWKNS